MASVVCPRASCLRTLAPRRLVLTGAKPAASSFSTFTASKHPKLSISPSPRTSIVTRRLPQHAFRAFHAPSAIAIRHASTSTPAASNTTSEEVLTWDRFFALRRKRRYINLGCSLVTAAAAIGVFGPVIAQQDIDSWGAQISGLDPILVLGVTTFLVAAGGWLCGPSFGTALFKVWAGRKGWNIPIAEKEKSFYARIKRYRADPSSSSPQNPIPDYYGEKIASVKDYRRWLKDQRAFNLKKNKNMI